MSTNLGYIGDNQVIAGYGGLVAKFTAAVALKIGDSVFLSAANTVSKSITAGDRLKRIGVVVGGDAFGDRETTDANSIGDEAAAIGGEVMVCYSGVAIGVAGAVAVTAFAPLMFDATTAGRLVPATPATDAGKIVGMAIEAQATAGSTFKLLVALH